MMAGYECIHNAVVSPQNVDFANCGLRPASRALLITALAVLTGCATNFELAPTSGGREASQYPTPGRELFVRSGERVAARGRLTIGQELMVRRTTIFGTRKAESALYCAFTIYPGSARQTGVFRSDSRRAECYGPFRAMITNRDGTTGNSTWGCNDERNGIICADSNSGDYFLVIENEVAELDAAASNLRIDPVITGASDLEWELVYDGRDGDVLDFVLREFDGDSEPAASRKLIRQDHGSSDEIQVRGMRLLIISADDRGILYRRVPGQ